MDARQTPGGPLLALRGITCRRGGRRLFEDVDLTLAAGTAMIVSGANGVGKSSLLRIAAGLLRPAAGAIERPEPAAWLGEQAALDGDRALGAALGFWARLDGAGDAALGAAMAAMGVEALAEVPVRYLSTGQRRRAAIARTIASGRALWLLDEPANGLDADGVARFGAAVGVHRAAGGAVLAATHLPLPIEDAARLAL